MSFNILDNPLIVQIFEGRKQMHWLKVYQGGKGVIEWKNSSLSDKWKEEGRKERRFE